MLEISTSSSPESAVSPASTLDSGSRCVGSAAYRIVEAFEGGVAEDEL